MIGNILKIVGFLPFLFKKTWFMAAGLIRKKRHESLEREIEEKSDKLSDSELRNILK